MQCIRDKSKYSNIYSSPFMPKLIMGSNYMNYRKKINQAFFNYMEQSQKRLGRYVNKNSYTYIPNDEKQINSSVN